MPSPSLRLERSYQGLDTASHSCAGSETARKTQRAGTERGYREEGLPRDAAESRVCADEEGKRTLEDTRRSGGLGYQVGQVVNRHNKGRGRESSTHRPRSVATAGRGCRQTLWQLRPRIFPG